MNKRGTAFYHKLFGEKKMRAVYHPSDFLDYMFMVVATAGVVVLAYGWRSPMGIAGLILCAISLLSFVRRHGVELKVPLLLRRPQELIYTVAYKLHNLRWHYVAALGLLLLQCWLVKLTPSWPHHLELARKIAFGLFYLHVALMVVYRTVILVDHLRKRELVREVLMQTAWKKVVNENTSVTLEILHAYCTGLLTHLTLIAPWYLVITLADFSLLFAPVMCVLGAVIQMRWFRVHNSWFYRDHWLGHNCEFDFVYLHGPHHDAIPSGLIGVAGNGYLEGVLRHVLAVPQPFHHPLISFLINTYEVKNDIDLHQYIPGIFPKLTKRMIALTQHSSHHYGRLEPYGLGMKVDQPWVSDELRAAFKAFPDEVTNSAKLDEELTGFQWDNPTHRKTMELYEKYQD